MLCRASRSLGFINKSKSSITSALNLVPSTVRFMGTDAGAPHSKSDYYGSVDGNFEKYRIDKKNGDYGRRDFVYFVLGGARFFYVSAIRVALMRVSEYQPVVVIVIIVLISD